MKRPADLIDRLLVLGGKGTGKGPGALNGFAAALRERSRLILDERLRPLEERVASTEKELAWRAGLTEALQAALAASQFEQSTLLAASVEERAWRVEIEAALRAELSTLREDKGRADRELLDSRQQEERTQRALLAEREWRQSEVRAIHEEAQWRAESQRSLEREVAALRDEIASLRREWEAAAGAHDRLFAHHRDVLRQLAESLEGVQGLRPWHVRQARARLAQTVAALRSALP